MLRLLLLGRRCSYRQDTNWLYLTERRNEQGVQVAFRTSVGDNLEHLTGTASLGGKRGIVRITPGREATLVVSGNDLAGLAFLEDGCAALATRDALFHVALDIEGRKLV